MKIKVWNKTDVLLRCERCGKEIVIPKGKEIETDEVVQGTSGGWRYFYCLKEEKVRTGVYDWRVDKCFGIMEIFTKTKTGKWRYKSRSIFTHAIVSYHNQ